ncbi:MAG: YkvA family protein [Eggerthellaceae bacterium]|nr:YkvA family protein [Eggerthellaceae bacterium]
MAEQVSEESARSILDFGMAQAKTMLNDPDSVDDLLGQVKERVSNLPGALAGSLAKVPTMASMIKSYITGEYTEISPKVIACVLGALIYLVKGKDLIPDSIPILGWVDDIAVVALAIKLNEKEIRAFEAWRLGFVLPEDAEKKQDTGVAQA